MPSSVNYTDLGKVVAALAFQSPEVLNTNISVGAVSITLNQNPPNDWQVGASLVLDSNNPQLRETVTITGAPFGAIVPISATVNAHVSGAPVINGTIVANYIGDASRRFDTLTYWPEGFAYEQVSNYVVEAIYNNRGLIVIELPKPKAIIADVTSATFQSSPIDQMDTLDLTKGWIRYGNLLEVVATRGYYERKGMAVVTFKGGFNPIPDDISSAATIIAARLYKERDSGYADVVGNAETGIFEYKKALPADVAAIVQKYRRWSL